MEEDLAKLRIRFPTLPQDTLKEIYKHRVKRLAALKYLGFPENVCCIIEAQVRLAGELNGLPVKRLPGMGKSSYSKKRRAKRLAVCHKCARWNCDTKCRNVGMASINRMDKIYFIKDGLSKESLTDIPQTLETHPSGMVQNVLLKLTDLHHKEKERYSLGNLTLNDPVCQFMRKLDEMKILNS